MIKLYKYMDKKFRFLSILTIFLTTIQVISFLFIPIFIGQITSLIAQKSFINANPDLKTVDYINVKILKMFTVSGTLSEALKYFSIYFAIALFIGSIAVISGSLLGSYVSNAGAKQIRQRLWEHLNNLSEKDIEYFTHSKILTRFTIDINRIQTGINMFLRLSIIGPFNLIFGLVFALLTDLKLSVTLGILVPILAITMFVSGIVITPYFAKEQKMYEELNNESQESVLGIKVIKSYNLEKLQNQKFENKNIEAAKISKKSWNSFNLTFAFVNLFSNIITALILLVTGYISRNSNSDFEAHKNLISNAATFTNYVTFITIGVVMSAFLTFSLAKAYISAREINKIFKRKSEIDYVNSDKKITEGIIKFDHVSFKYYLDSEKNVLEDISFEAKPGETIGIIGPTGSGKSTIAKLLSLDFKPTYGTIKIDNYNIKEIDTRSLRKSVSHVYQKPILLSGSIKSNLLMANHNATEEEMIDSLKQACAYDFVFKLENKLESTVLAKGSNFSGGQKQRLSIAQGLIKKPKILILDDSTSALDANTEAQIKNNLKTSPILSKLVTIIIAQKISSIMHADNILVLDNGKIVDSGNHNYLFKNCKLYKEIVNSQMGGDDV
ncbi:ABC transporter ATP-binding protein [Metamycoplasma canadense]|uniref:ABC transporter ATP binding protein n=1 Tax=Metamycoplasma canadense TaxID=29554 RepID=A0A077L6V7_9BACT|nr:ABC transporter ATP-binding protein [Metamycoplasma canadense]BAP39526.1 ABC transporter ATP binding protein [Metamycoplasma canadense]